MSDEATQVGAEQVTPVEVHQEPETAQQLREAAEKKKLELRFLRESAGFFKVNDSMTPEDYMRVTKAARAAGEKVEWEAAEEGQSRDAQGKFTSANGATEEPKLETANPDGTENDADAPDPFGIGKEHPHRARAAEAEQYYGPHFINEIEQKLRGVPIADGVARMIANFDNSIDMLIELANHPEREQIGAWLSYQPQERARQFLTEVSRSLSGDSKSVGAPSTKAPKPITPVTKSSAADSNSLRDDLDSREWQKRFLAQRASR
jgi:hypothetical protein